MDQFINSLKRPDKKSKSRYPYDNSRFDFTVEGSITKFLGVNIYKSKDKIILR